VPPLGDLALPGVALVATKEGILAGHPRMFVDFICDVVNPMPWTIPNITKILPLTRLTIFFMFLWVVKKPSPMIGL